MEEIRELQKRYCTKAMFIAAGAAVILIILGEKAMGKGLVLGSLFSVLNFVLLARSIPVKLAASDTESKARRVAFTAVATRFLLLAVPLIVAIRIDSINFVTVAIGLYMVQLILFFDHLFPRVFSQ
jgi:hypothetical protein